VRQFVCASREGCRVQESREPDDLSTCGAEVASGTHLRPPPACTSSYLFGTDVAHLNSGPCTWQGLGDSFGAFFVSHFSYHNVSLPAEHSPYVRVFSLLQHWCGSLQRGSPRVAKG